MDCLAKGGYIAFATNPDLMHLVHTYFLTVRLFSRTLIFLTFGCQIFLVLLLEWLTLHPICIDFPHISHLAMDLTYY